MPIPDSWLPALVGGAAVIVAVIAFFWAFR